MHPNVTMIWRPVSGGRFLEYMVEYVMEALGAISWTLLTVLGIVSYNNNINGLGCATNFSIIKSLSGTCFSYLLKKPLFLRAYANLNNVFYN